MNISTRFVEGIPVVEPAGRIDAESADRLEELLATRLADQPAMLIIDLSAAGVVSSAGLRVLLRCAQRIRGQGCLVLCGAGPAIRELLDLAGLDRLMRVSQDLDSALQSAACPA